MSKFEIYTPQHPEDQKLYRLTVLRLESELILGSGHQEEHWGISYDLEHIVSTMETLKYPINGVHDSCLSNTFVLPSTNLPLTIHCIMFQRDKDPMRYHIGFVHNQAAPLEDTKRIIQSYYQKKYNTNLTWGKKLGSGYYVTSRELMVSEHPGESGI